MSTRATFDDASGLVGIAKLKLARELSQIRTDVNALALGAGNALKKLRLSKRAQEIRLLLGGGRANTSPVAVAHIAPAGDAAAEAANGTLAPRSRTDGFYAFDPNRPHAQRKKDNAAAMALLGRIDAGDVSADALTALDKLTLAKYSGTGGALKGADGKKGSAYEYYTPKPIAQAVWDLLGALGFSGGKVLDPCAGVGIFGATAPLSAAVDAVELNETSGRINALVNSGPGYSAVVSPFEKVAAVSPDDEYDAVVTNVPFGGVADRGGNQWHDRRYQKEPLQNYFILRSLEKLRPGGLAAFITPHRCVSGKGGKEADLRIAASYLAEFLGAYRLPNAVFGTADADTVTDICVFRKYSRDVLDKIAELREQSPATLVDANVQWQEFIGGHYFEGDGKRFVLGEYKPKAQVAAEYLEKHGKPMFRPVDRVDSTASVADIGKLIRTFPASRIKWDVLDAVETAPILYKDGDTITQAGTTLQYEAGRWLPLPTSAQDEVLAVAAGDMATPYRAFEAQVSWKSAMDFVGHMIRTGQTLDTPGWLRSAVRDIEKLNSDADKARYWAATVVGLSIKAVTAEHFSDATGTHFIEDYPALSDAMRVHWATAKQRPGLLGGSVKDACAEILKYYNRKTGFNAVWRGDVKQAVDVLATTADMTFEGIRYRSKSAWVPLAQAIEVFGEDFDPFTDPDWCVSADGKSVTRADDFYVGNVSHLLDRLDQDIAAADNGAVKGKLLWMKANAEARVDKLDVERLSFQLFNPLVTPAEKVDFLRKFVHPNAGIFYENKSGGDLDEPIIDIRIPGSSLTDREKLLNRLGAYLSKGTLTLQGIETSMTTEDALRELRKMVQTANEQFNTWVRGNPAIMARLRAEAHRPDKLRFRQVEDEACVDIPGIRADWRLHGYQNAFIRKMGREFGGINGFNVGLGKTSTALAAVQYAQAIGVKTKTAFVVPNAVLSNWRKEVGKVYAHADDCLFIGLKENKAGKLVVDPALYDADLSRIQENRHGKIFMSYEAWERIRLREETIDAFMGYMGRVDASFTESDDKKQDERKNSEKASKRRVLANKSGSAPYLEDLGIDSVVIDEAHSYKNSSETIDFKQAKYLSLAAMAKRGLDMQAKAWFIRGRSALADGVLSLTATAITNSPLEIYSMLSLAVGHDRVNDLCLGIRGADHFMEMMCAKENQDDVTIDGELRMTDVFVGLNNASVLRKAIADTATIKSAEDVGEQIVVPDASEKQTGIDLPQAVVDRLQTYKSAFRFAIDSISGKSGTSGSQAAFEQVSEHFDEPIKLVGHPFNLINKMTLLIADPELDERATFYVFTRAQAEKARKAVEAFNAKKYKEDRPRRFPHTEADAVVNTRVKVDDNGEEKTTYTVEVRARIVGNRIRIDAYSPDMQDRFERIAEAAGLDWDVSIPPKLAALIENVQKEQAHPRGVDDAGQPSPIVKQIVFCDILPMHNKIKRALSKYAGIPAGKIAIITGQINNEPEQILSIQDGFNAHGEDNRYQVILANEKAEVGINLQKGTQAIHHLTIGWTPDSLTQRNGRGVRQGNRTAAVNIYYYDAAGTFDSVKRVMVAKKSAWIDSVMAKQGGDRIHVSGGISNEDMERMVNSVGNAEDMRRAQEEMEAKQTEARAATTRAKQAINLDTITKNRAFLLQNDDATRMVKDKIVSLWELTRLADKLRDRISAKGATPSAITRNQEKLVDADANIAGLRRDIAASASFTNYRGDTITVDDIFARMAHERRQNADIVMQKIGHFTMRLAEDGPIVQDWQTDVDLAKSMMEGAIRQYEALAEEHGAQPAALARALSTGEATTIAGHTVMNGTFARRLVDGDCLGVVSIRNDKVHDFPVLNKDGTYAVFSTRDIGGFALVDPGAADYDACLTDAAEREDAAARSGLMGNRFSDVVPEVMQRRKEEGIAEYRIADYLLPPPYHPFVVTEEQADDSPVLRMIYDQQQAVVRATGRGTFRVPASLGVIKREAHHNASLAIRDFAIAHDARIGRIDLGGLYHWREAMSELLDKAITPEAFAAAIRGKDVAAIHAAVDAFIEEKTPWFQWPTGDAKGRAGVLGYHFLAIIDKAVAAAKTDAPQAPGWTVLPSASSNSGNADDVVGIKGDTMAWKSRIKAMATSHRYKAKWDGRAEIWNIKRKTWNALIAAYPAAEQALELTTGSQRTL